MPVLRGPDWPAAAKELKAALVEHPRHPLVLLLLAWCWEHEQTIASREQYLQWLRDAASDVPGPARFIAQGNFSSLQPGERYEILARQPAESRAGDDHEQLARAALTAGLLQIQKALEHAEAALPVDRYEWACRMWNVAGQPERVIGLLEERLRRGRGLSDSELVELALAYRQANRPVDARRAETTARIPKPNQGPTPNQRAPQGMGGGMF